MIDQSRLELLYMWSVLAVVFIQKFGKMFARTFDFRALSDARLKTLNE
jgi:hypothetical protein